MTAASNKNEHKKRKAPPLAGKNRQTAGHKPRQGSRHKASKPKAVKDPGVTKVEAKPKLTPDQVRTIAAKERMLKAMAKHLGIVTDACKTARIGRTMYYEWMKEDPDFKEAINAVADLALDFVESQLFKQIRRNNYVSTIFYLKTKGKNRGYIERTILDAKVSIGSAVIDWTGEHHANNNANTKTA